MKTTFSPMNRAVGRFAFFALVAFAAPPQAAAAAPGPRLTDAQRTLFTAASDPYASASGMVDPDEADRATSLRPFLEDTDPRASQLARAVTDFMELNRRAETEGVPPDEVVAELEGDWHGFLGDSVLRALGGEPENSVLDRTEAMSLTAQEAAITNRRLELLGANLRRAAREAAAAIAAEGDSGRPTVQGAIEVALRRVGGFVHMRVRNRTTRPLHHGVITARRLQDPARLTAADEDRAMAAGLMGLFGFSGEAIRTNDDHAVLLQAAQQAEHGAFVFVPLLPPQAAVEFIVAPAEHFEFTRAVSASLWCDEGQERDVQVDLPAFYRETYAAQEREAQSHPEFRTPPPASGRRPLSPGRSPLQGATGLNGARGL